MFCSYAVTYLLLGTPLLTLQRLSGVFILMICAAGVVSANRRAQVVIAVLGLLFEIFVVGYLRFEPGTWVPSEQGAG